MHTSNNAIDGPDWISRMYANKIPINEQLIPHICVPIRVDLNERPIWLAVKTGIINNAETRIIPNSFTPQMRAIDVPIKRKYLLNVTGKLITYAYSVWIVVIISDLHCIRKSIIVSTKNNVNPYISIHWIDKRFPKR